MTTYQGPHAGIANGNPFLANQVENSFDRFAESVNAVDDTNFPTNNTLTYRSVHPGALTQTFGESQVIYQEPACWVAIGRGGTTKTTDYSLGSSENLYTVDGCSTRVVVSRDGVIKVNSFIEIESIKVSQEIKEGATTRKIWTVDLDIEFKLKFMEAGETHASATTLHTVRRRQKVLVWDGVTGLAVDVLYEAAKGYRRGLSVSLGDDVTISGADPNGSAYDLFVTIEPTIVAAHAESAAGTSDRAISNPNYDEMLFLAHLRSRSRYTSARFFLE
jgi:hypothetical protein